MPCFRLSKKSVSANRASRSRKTAFAIIAQTSLENQILSAWSKPADVLAVETANAFKGATMCCMECFLLDGIGPDQLRIRELIARIENEYIAKKSFSH